MTFCRNVNKYSKFSIVCKRPVKFVIFTKFNMLFLNVVNFI